MKSSAGWRDPEELDEAVVCAEARRAACVQDTPGGSVGGHRAAAAAALHCTRCLVMAAEERCVL